MKQSKPQRLRRVVLQFFSLFFLTTLFSLKQVNRINLRKFFLRALLRYVFLRNDNAVKVFPDVIQCLQFTFKFYYSTLSTELFTSCKGNISSANPGYPKTLIDTWKLDFLVTTKVLYIIYQFYEPLYSFKF